MASSDRRRAGSASQHTARSGASSRSASSSIIAPPPRAQLGSHPNTSSPSLGADGGNDNDAGSIKDSASIKEKDLKEKETTAALLRDKDEKIAELGRKMAELEADFARQVERLSQSESETASFWKSKHSSLHQQFLRTDTELRLLRAEVEVREGESEELKEGWVYLKREIQERDDEIRRLRADLMGLKKWLSTNTRTEEQESDDLFGSDMTRLGNGLQEWAIQHFRRAKLDVSGASEAVIEELSQLVPMYQELIKSAKLPLLQSIVSTILVQMIFGAYFVGLSKEQEQQFRRTEESLASLSNEESVNQWRALTLSVIRKEASEKLQEETTAIVEAAIAKVNRILDSIASASTTDARDQALRALVNSSVELARRLAVQKAVFKVTMPQILPHQQTLFDVAEMEDIGGEDEDSLTEREICCVAFPGMVKSGDEHGSHPQYRNIVARARVLCSPE